MNDGEQQLLQRGQTTMANTVSAMRVINQKDGFANRGQHSAGQAKRAKTYNSLPKSEETQPRVQPESNLRISPAAQLPIIKLYLEGHSLSEISRQTHRARQTVTKVCRSDEVQAKLQALKERLLGESDDWVESVSYAVQTEQDGALAMKLLLAFGIIPSEQKKPEPVKEDIWKSIDPHELAMARELGLIAMERGSSRPPEADELEEQVQKTRMRFERKSRLFDSRDTD
jgi:hypothetical protein